MMRRNPIRPKSPLKASAYLKPLDELEQFLLLHNPQPQRAARLSKSVGWVSDGHGGMVFGVRVLVDNSDDFEYVQKTFPKKIGKLPVRAEKRLTVNGLRAARGSDDGRWDELVGGIRISNVRTGAEGTLGAVMFDAVTGDPLILSCAHVLVNNDPRDRHHPDRDLITQPATGQDEDIVGEVVRSDAALDCAVARVFPNKRGVSSKILDLGSIKGLVTQPEVEMPVVKMGCASQKTHGIISNVQRNGVIMRPSPGPDSTLAADGDSGSIWLQEGTNLAVGLLYRVQEIEHGGLEAVASRMTRVLETLRLSWKKPRA